MIFSEMTFLDNVSIKCICLFSCFGRIGIPAKSLELESGAPDDKTMHTIANNNSCTLHG